MRWTGTRRDGVAAGGAVEGTDAGELAQRLYRRGYKTATILHDGDNVGGVGPHRDTGRRVWWGATCSG